MVRPLLPRPRPAQAPKCLKNTRLSAGASVKTLLSTHLTKPDSRKEKQSEKPYSLSSNSLKTHKEKDYRNGRGAKELRFMPPHSFLFCLACNEAVLSKRLKQGEERTGGIDCQILESDLYDSMCESKIVL
ncbi:unnamed protein product [Pleuronectes platessa]|uniref:Uncharacterized protein n=1 Tax=Pleuronectes platessa TaxID=8262 RepID=A0A9N7YCE1_PLEPL|nr:unnamed protein product [Pleuronectes platessa]